MTKQDIIDLANLAEGAEALILVLTDGRRAALAADVREVIVHALRSAAEGME
jgi:hypothetical protein